MSVAQFDPAKTTIYPGVKFGKNVRVHDFCVIGMPARGQKPGDVETVIGDNAIIRPFTVIYAGVTIGANFQCGQSVTIRETNVIGDDCSVGTCCVMEIGNRLADRVRVHTYTVMGHATVEERALVGPAVMLLDDPHPQCPKYEECVGGPVVKRYARIGARVIVNPGITIGENSLVASGMLVLEDVPANVLYAGRNPRVVKRIEAIECFKGYYSRAYEWDPPELFDAAHFPKPKD